MDLRRGRVRLRVPERLNLKTATWGRCGTIVYRMRVWLDCARKMSLTTQNRTAIPPPSRIRTSMRGRFLTPLRTSLKDVFEDRRSIETVKTSGR